jgi:hypothetical protein
VVCNSPFDLVHLSLTPHNSNRNIRLKFTVFAL